MNPTNPNDLCVTCANRAGCPIRQDVHQAALNLQTEVEIKHCIYYDDAGFIGVEMDPEDDLT